MQVPMFLFRFMYNAKYIYVQNTWAGNTHKSFFSYWSCLLIVYLLGFFLQKQTQQLRQQLEGEIKNHESVKKVLQETRQQLEGTKEQVTL